MTCFNSTKGLSHMCFHKTRACSPPDPQLVRELDFPCSHWEKPFQSTSPSSYSNSSQSMSDDKSCTISTLHFLNMISLKGKLQLKREIIIYHVWDCDDWLIRTFLWFQTRMTLFHGTPKETFEIMVNEWGRKPLKGCKSTIKVHLKCSISQLFEVFTSIDVRFMNECWIFLWIK